LGASAVYDPFQIRPPESVLPEETIVIDPDKGLEVVLDAAVIIRILRVSGAINNGRKRHDFSPSSTSSDRASIIPLGFDSPPLLVMTTVPLPPGMTASFLPEPKESHDCGPVSDYDRYHELGNAELEPLFPHTKPKGKEEERGSEEPRPESLEDSGEERPPEELVSLVGKVPKRVHEFHKIHDRASLFYIVLLIYNVFNAGIFDGKITC